MKKIIIGIPVYNGASTIEKTFISLKKAIIYCKSRCSCDIEIVFIPNGCTDETESLIRKIIEQNNDLVIKIKTLSKACKTAAINTLKDNEADYIGYVDDDVTFSEGAIYEEVFLLNNDKNVWAVFVDSFPLLCKKNVSWWAEVVYNALTMRTRFKLLAKRYDLLMGRCVLIRKDKMPFIPEGIVNEDQFLDYFLYPHVKKIDKAFVYYEGVYSVKKYFQRDVRITMGRKQLKTNLSSSITGVVDNGRSKAINYKKLFKFPINIIMLYIVYRIIYRISKIMVAIYLLINNKPQWKRTT